MNYASGDSSLGIGRWVLGIGLHSRQGTSAFSHYEDRNHDNNQNIIRSRTSLQTAWRDHRPVADTIRPNIHAGSAHLHMGTEFDAGSQGAAFDTGSAAPFRPIGAKR